MKTSATDAPASPPTPSDFPVLAAQSPAERIQFALVQFPDDPDLKPYLLSLGVAPDQADELIALAQSWAQAARRGLTPEERQQAAAIAAGPPILVDARAGLTEPTKTYLRSLHPGQPIDYRFIRAQAAVRASLVRHQVPRPVRRSARSVHAARAICGGSDGDGSGGSDDGPADPPVTPPESPAVPQPDVRRVTRHVSIIGRNFRKQAEDIAADGVLHVLERQAAGEAFTYPTAAAKAEAAAILHRLWRSAATVDRDAAEAAAILKPSRGRHIRGAQPPYDDGLTPPVKVRLPLDSRGRGKGRFRYDDCSVCSLWTWRNGRRVRRKDYQRPVFPRWTWRDGALVIQWSCPACRPRRAPALIRWPGETWLLIGEKAQELYKALWEACRKFYGLNWTLAPGETFSNGLGVIPPPPLPVLLPTYPRTYSRRRAHRRSARLLDEIPVASLDRFPRPAVNVTDADLEREAHALRQARRRRPTTPAVTEGRVPPGAALVCATCRTARPFKLSCAHTLHRTHLPPLTSTTGATQ